jgi:hypothetical protein
MAWTLISERNGPKKVTVQSECSETTQNCMAFSDLISEVTSHPFCSTGRSTLQLAQTQRDVWDKHISMRRLLRWDGRIITSIFEMIGERLTSMRQPGKFCTGWLCVYTK